jgi:GTPase SAR1 family protein
MLIGNKCDMPDEKVKVTDEEGRQKAEKYGIPFCETSAKENINIDKAFMTIARDMKLKIEREKKRPRKTI